MTYPRGFVIISAAQLNANRPIRSRSTAPRLSVGVGCSLPGNHDSPDGEQATAQLRVIRLAVVHNVNTKPVSQMESLDGGFFVVRTRSGDPTAEDLHARTSQPKVL